MKLLTKEILKQFEKQGDTSEKSIDEITVIAKFFGGSAYTWYLYEYNAEYGEFMAFVNLGCHINAELGRVSFDELQQLRFPPFNLPIERDRSFKPMPLRNIMNKVKAGGHV